MDDSSAFLQRREEDERERRESQERQRRMMENLNSDHLASPISGGPTLQGPLDSSHAPNLRRKGSEHESWLGVVEVSQPEYRPHYRGAFKPAFRNAS